MDISTRKLARGGGSFSQRAEQFCKIKQKSILSGVWYSDNETLELSEDGSEITMRMSNGDIVKGANFVAGSYLSLTRDPRILKMASESVSQHGLDVLASPAFTGRSTITWELEKAICNMCHKEGDSLIYDSGWKACYGVPEGLLREGDHAILDERSHNSLQSGVRKALLPTNIHKFKHLDTEDAIRTIDKVRTEFPDASIVFITETLFSMDNDTPDLKTLIPYCKKNNIFTIVDVAHDMGVLGETGRSQLEVQGVLDEVDIVVGTFPKAFATGGGYAACKDKNVCDYLRMYSSSYLFTRHLSIPQQEAALESLRIIFDTPEGKQRRDRVAHLANRLRDGLSQVATQEQKDKILQFDRQVVSGIVILHIGSTLETSKLAIEMARRGVMCTIAIYPACPEGDARIRLLLQPALKDEQIDHAIDVITKLVLQK